MTNLQFEKEHKEELSLFNEGKLFDAYRLFGAHPCEEDGIKGTRFTVWVPGAESVSAAGDFNGWDKTAFYLMSLGKSGVWSGFVPEADEGMAYKYVIKTKDGKEFYKADPFALFSEKRPGTASIIADIKYCWSDDAWIGKREKENHFKKPVNIYEVHPGSWMQHEKKNRDDRGEQHFLSYKELEDRLLPYVKEMGYTHLELMPVMEHPLDDSWGYQLTGYFAPTSRFGNPGAFKHFIDKAHHMGIGIILDWVPGHFCKDDQGLRLFNGQMLYEKKDHIQWGTCIFDFGRPEVKSFLLSNAMFWLKEYHADGLRVDGVSSMLYLNFGIENEKDKVFNRYGEEINLEAAEFLKELNILVGERCAGCFTAAEESTAYPMVTKPPKDGGLGFHYKWNMGWMNDTLDYVSTDYLFRKGKHEKLTFSSMYMYSENYILPLSHDEVVHGKKSLIDRQQGDYERKFEGIRLLALYQMTHPGRKLNFMGNEIAQFIEWRFYEGLEWFLLDYPAHRQYRDFIKKLNHIYLQEKALWDNDFSPNGFKWIDADNREQSVLVYERYSQSGRCLISCILNFGWNGYEKFRIGVSKPGLYRCLISTDGCEYPDAESERISCHGKEYSIEITLPRSGGLILKRIGSIK